MKSTWRIIITTFFPLYLATVLFTDFSLAGFWTDIIFSIVLSILSIRCIIKAWGDKSVIVIVVNGSCLLTVMVVMMPLLLNPFSQDYLKLRSFYYQSVVGRLFNAYFKPVGSYSGGYGNFRVTETPKYFPLIEHQVYYNRTVDYNFNDDTFDSQPMDNYEVVRDYIRQEVINTQNGRK